MQGTLVNEGKNYFTDRRVVLQEKSGEKIHVRPWLPLSVPPMPPGSKEAPRATLSDYLGKRVELEGTIEKGSVRGVGETHMLVVRKARILE
ncbi:MAG: hypothetical protein U0Q16_35195 [Bryobacteraceae bacterium]